MVKLSIGKISQDIGFSLMKFGLSIVKPNIPENTYWALDSAISDSELACKLNIPRFVMSAEDLQKLIQSKCRSTVAWLWDNKYYYTSVDAFKQIMNTDTINRMKWIADYHDCDNFATEFSAYIDIFFQLNSVGIAIGEVLDKQGKVIGYHAWNCVILQENDKPELYYYEPQADILKKADSCIVDMDWARYSANLIIFK